MHAGKLIIVCLIVDKEEDYRTELLNEGDGG